MATLKSASQVSEPGAVEPSSRVVEARRVKLQVSAALFWRICRENPDLRLERTAQGKLIVMSPAGLGSSGRNMKLCARLNNWTEANGTGVAYDSSAGYRLPNGAIRGPDASWVSQARLTLIPLEDRERLPRVSPEFVAEIRSPSDRLKSLQRKMREYIAQGVRLGWLIDPFSGQVEIHRADGEPEVLQSPATLSGEGVLPGFVLDLRGILFE